MNQPQREHDIILDEWLVICCRDGDAEMAALLVQRWHPRLARYALRLSGGDREAAADAVQEAWVAIMQGIRGIRDPAAFPAWAYGITRRKAADWVRQQQRSRQRQRQRQRSRRSGGTAGGEISRHTPLSRGEAGQQHLDESPADPGATRSRDRAADRTVNRGSINTDDLQASDAMAPDATFEASTERSALHRAIAELPEDQRELLLLYYIDGFGVQEIARILEVQPGTVKSRLFRTRASLREMLEKET